MNRDIRMNINGAVVLVHCNNGIEVREQKKASAGQVKLGEYLVQPRLVIVFRLSSAVLH